MPHQHRLYNIWCIEVIKVWFIFITIFAKCGDHGPLSVYSICAYIWGVIWCFILKWLCSSSFVRKKPKKLKRFLSLLWVNRIDIEWKSMHFLGQNFVYATCTWHERLHDIFYMISLQYVMITLVTYKCDPYINKFH